MAETTERVEFPGSQGGSLAARLDRPRGPVRAWALFAHCFSCSKDVVAATRISRRLSQLGVAVLRFDFTGLGSSQGDFANTNFSSNVDDLVAAADWLRENRGAPEIVIGHSLGGAAVLSAAARMPDAKAFVTIAAPSDVEHVRGLIHGSIPEIETAGEAEVRLGGRPFKITRQFLNDLSAHNVESVAAGLKRALLVCHAPLDETVGIDHATRIFVAARHPKSFVSLDSADHLLTRADDARYAADVIAAWSTKFISRSRVETPASVDGGVVVRETKTGKFTNHVVAGDHALLADEPEEMGGDDAGPSPYQWLLGALGACTSMTLRLYAERKGWELERSTVTLRHAKEHFQDCEDCLENGSEARVDVISREIALEGALDDDQRAKLLEIADKCPVHRTLESRVTIRTRLDDTDQP